MNKKQADRKYFEANKYLIRYWILHGVIGVSIFILSAIYLALEWVFT